jgi:hypothetical protein
VADVIGPVCVADRSRLVVSFVRQSDDWVVVSFLARRASTREITEARALDAPPETAEQTCARCLENRRTCGGAPSCTQGYLDCLLDRGLGALACEQ